MKNEKRNIGKKTKNRKIEKIDPAPHSPPAQHESSPTPTKNCNWQFVCLAAFGGLVLSVLRFCVFFRVFLSRSLQNRSGTCLNASWVFFASNLHMEMCTIIGQSIGSEHFWILQFWEFFCQPFGENTFSKNGPKTKIEKLKNLKVV